MCQWAVQGSAWGACGAGHFLWRPPPHLPILSKPCTAAPPHSNSLWLISKALHVQWSNLFRRDCPFHHPWQSPEGNYDIIQILVPCQLGSKVLQLAQQFCKGSHVQVAKTLHTLQSQKRRPLRILCDFCMAWKGSTGCLHTPLKHCH